MSICPVEKTVLSMMFLMEASRVYRGYLFFSVKDRNLFHRVDTIGNIFTSGEATSENVTGGEKISGSTGIRTQGLRNTVPALYH